MDLRLKRHGQPGIREVRHLIYEMMEHGPIGNRSSRLLSRIVVGLIIVNLTAIVLESVPELAAKYANWFDVIEYISLGTFTVELALRIWVAPEHAPYHHLSAFAARLKFVASPAGIIDFLAVVPFWFAFVIPANFRIVLVLRVIRVLKLARYSPGMRSLLDALNSERRALFGCLVILLGATLVSATAMHMVERYAQPDKFGTIPEAMWWAIVTLGTIGYGDAVPITTLGRVISAATIFTGLIMVALPVGIIATAFANEIHRRDFVVTWGMVARVPLFSGLNASEIADVMRLLRAQQVEPGDTIARRGEAAHSMYFVAAGEVEIELKHEHKRVRLGAGHFFGEIAVLRQSRRSATITAVTRTSLLVLDAHDLRALMDREPRVAERVHEVVRSRLGSEVVTQKGDLITEELVDEDSASVTGPGPISGKSGSR
jgi:voltage-gated potassium channel